MKKRFSFRRFIRLGSAALVVISVSLNLVLSGTAPDPSELFEFLFSGVAVLACCYLPHESHVRHAVCSACMLAVSLILFLFRLEPRLKVVILSACLVTTHVIFIREKYVRSKYFFCNAAVWHNIEDNERSILVSAALLLAMFFLLTLHCAVLLQWVAVILVAVLFIFLYLYMYYGWYVLVGKSTRDDIRRNLRGRVLPAVPARNDDETRRMESLFTRVKEMMEESRPYLDPDFSEIKLASLVFSNQNYLSRTVNAMSGMNFKQFVNGYRVQYAEELMAKNPHMQVKELAVLSGFNSTPSFNMAFKLFRGMTPGRYMKDMYQYEDARGCERQSSFQEKVQ